MYCMAFEKYSRTDEILLGGTFMRQNNFIFDIDNNRVGIARATCNDDANQVKDEVELFKSKSEGGSG